MSGMVPKEHPDVFIDYQKELMTTTAVERVLVIEKSRRTGYSWAAAAIATLTAAAAPSADGQDVWYMGYDLEMAREFIEYVGEWAKTLNEITSEVEEYFIKDPKNPDKDIQTFRMTFPSGFKVVALASVARALRGKQGMVILDEAAFHDDLEAVLKAAMALLMWGGKVLVISTHDGEDNPFNQLVNEIRSGKKPYKLIRCDFDRAISEGLYERIAMKVGLPLNEEAKQKWVKDTKDFYGDDADEELFCIPSKGGGAYMSAALVSACATVGIPVFRLERPNNFVDETEEDRKADIEDWCEENLLPILKKLNKSLPTYFGHDFARSGDLSVFWPLQLSATMDRLTPFILEMRNIPFKQQEQILIYIIDHLPRFSGGAMDARGNGSHLAELLYQKYKNIERVMLTQNWYREEMPPYKQAYEDKTITIPKDQDVIGDHRMVVMDGGVPKVPDSKKRKGMDGKLRHGDSAIAGALAYFATNQEYYEYEGYQTSSEISRGATDPDHRSKDLAMTAEEQYAQTAGRFDTGAF